jgi:hypothetical protein
MGGLLNPLFGFLAFVGVLITLHLQTTQLKIARRQSELEELQRLISLISKDADSILSQKPRFLGDPPVENEQITLWQILSAVGTAVLNDDPRAAELESKMLDIISLPTQTLLVELHQLVWSLESYKAAGGSSTVVEFYKKRYEVVVCWIHASGLLKENPRVKAYFDPETLAPLLRVR